MRRACLYQASVTGTGRWWSEKQPESGELSLLAFWPRSDRYQKSVKRSWFLEPRRRGNEVLVW
jgi:hypothetical protein